MTAHVVTTVLDNKEARHSLSTPQGSNLEMILVRSIASMLTCDRI